MDQLTKRSSPEVPPARGGTPSAATTPARVAAGAAEDVARAHLILALDVADLDAARALLAKLRCTVGAVKIGKELFTREGPAAVRVCHDAGLPVFLDLKFHDIPNTVAGAVRSAATLAVRWLSLHIAGGEDMLRAAVQARDAMPPGSRPKLLGVTVLTSQRPPDDPEEIVERALLAQRCGLDGAIASPTEVARLRAACGADFLLVTPGVRLPGTARHDQARVATPAEAMRCGASYIVVGRPIYGATEPARAAGAVVLEMAHGLAEASGLAANEQHDAACVRESSVEARLLRLLWESGAILEGHFLLSSGLHSNRYVQCAQLLCWPHAARRAGLWLAERLRRYDVEIVTSVALGGVVLGQDVAAALGVPAYFAERDPTGGLSLRRGFALSSGTRVAIVDDVCTRGGSIAECIDVVRAHGAHAVVTGALIDRSSGDRAFDVPFEALLQIEAHAVRASDCRQCAAGLPVEKPGSRPAPNP